MYQPAHSQFVEARPEALHKLIRDYPLGTLITRRGDDIVIDHVPFLYDARDNTLVAHVPRANPVWQALEGQSALIAFHGPNAYISPSWYPSKHLHGKAVPTWNYAVVHVQGKASVIQDKDWLRQHIDDLTDAFEKEFAHPWRVSDAPADYIEKLLGAIVGLKIAIATIEGKFKLGQNRPPPDRMGVAAGLTASNSPMASFVRP